MSRFVIEVRTKGFTTAEATLKRTTNQTRKFARASNQAATAGATFRREVSAIRNNMLLYAFAIGGAVAALGRFVKASSDAKEQFDQFNIVFGDFAPKAEAFALSIQSSFGIAKSEMIGLLAGLQDTFVPLGFSREKASELSMSIAQLSIDVGAFKNIATGDVARRMTSALIGNHEAVRELGISLTEHTIKQEAMRLGIIEANEEMTQEAKIMGRISLIAKGTTDAVGNAAATQHEFASRLRGTQGRLLSTAEAMGDIIKPFATLTLTIVDSMANIRSFGIILVGLTSAFIAYKGAAIAGALATITFNAALKRNLIIAAFTGLAVLADKMVKFGKTAEEAAPKVKSLDELIKDFAADSLDLSGGLNAATNAANALKDAEESLKETQDKSIKSLRLRLALMYVSTELEKAAVTARINENRSLVMLESILLQQIDAIIAKNAATKEQIKIDKDAATAAELRNKIDVDALMQQISMSDKRKEIDFQALVMQKKIDGADDKQIAKMNAINTGLKDIAAATINLHGDYGTMINTVTDFNEKIDMSSLGIELQEGQQKKLVQAIISHTNKNLELIDSTKSATDTQKAFNNTQKVAASLIIATATALKSVTAEGQSFEAKFAAILRGAGSIMMMIPGLQVPGAIAVAASMFVPEGDADEAHTGGLIQDNGIQRFATGGMVQGEDNIPIMAQAGEFILRKKAVENLGINTLHALNKVDGYKNGGMVRNNGMQHFAKGGQVIGTKTFSDRLIRMMEPGSVALFNQDQMAKENKNRTITVNIHGNITGTKEFVRDTLIPEIEASMNKA